MSTPKKPQDHLEKVVKPKVESLEDGKRITFSDIPARDREGKTEVVDDKPRPLTVTVAFEALDDFELLDDLRAIDVDMNASRLPALLRRLVGDEYDDVMNALRNRETGRVQIAPAQVWIRRLMEALNPNS